MLSELHNLNLSYVVNSTNEIDLMHLIWHHS
jgi:hypothetical protein